MSFYKKHCIHLYNSVRDLGTHFEDLCLELTNHKTYLHVWQTNGLT